MTQPKGRILSVFFLVWNPGIMVHTIITYNLSYIYTQILELHICQDMVIHLGGCIVVSNHIINPIKSHVPSTPMSCKSY
jgi:hypothetical protein